MAEFLIFFSGKTPGNIAASRLKIGRTYAPLQPFKAKLCWNLNRLFWPLLRRRRTFAPLRLTSQISLFQLEFFDDFRTQGRAYTPVSAELCKLKIAGFEKKLRPSEDRSFSRFLRAHTWEEPFGIITRKPGQTGRIRLNF